MKLNFERNKNAANGSVARWKGLVVFLATGEVGEQDVMFVGSTVKKTAIFSKIASGKKVEDPSGFIRKKDGFIPKSVYGYSVGTMANQVYIADETFAQFNNIPLLRLGGELYIDQSNNCIGVEDPSMLLSFAKYHKDFINLLKGKKNV